MQIKATIRYHCVLVRMVNAGGKKLTSVYHLLILMKNGIYKYGDNYWGGCYQTHSWGHKREEVEIVKN